MEKNLQGDLTVFFDGGCPLCRREIDFYRRRHGADVINWLDINTQADDFFVPNLSRCDAMRRLHVQTRDGQLLSGAAAFAALWRALPGFRIIGIVAAIPPIQWCLEISYRVFLHFRPLWRRRIHP